jgi:hypothetical protein
MKTKYVLCLNNKGYEASLEKFKLYKAIIDTTGLKHNQIKVIDESGEDYYFPEDRFSTVELPRAARKVLATAY